jgi:hypothetical protein
MTGKHHLRDLSAFISKIGYKGTLIIIDELEHIMEQSPLRRRKAYTILRELIDNIDGENGMQSTSLYAAAVPGQFESQKGFIEVEALASRIQAPILQKARLTDYTGTIVDLDNASLSNDDLLTLAMRLAQIYLIARNLHERLLSKERVEHLVKEILTVRPYSKVRIREFCIELIGRFEITCGSRK